MRTSSVAALTASLALLCAAQARADFIEGTWQVVSNTTDASATFSDGTILGPPGPYAYLMAGATVNAGVGADTQAVTVAQTFQISNAPSGQDVTFGSSLQGSGATGSQGFASLAASYQLTSLGGFQASGYFDQVTANAFGNLGQDVNPALRSRTLTLPDDTYTLSVTMTATATTGQYRPGAPGQAVAALGTLEVALESAAVPEPTSAVLTALGGAAGLFWYRRRR